MAGERSDTASDFTLFLAGDVMTGRGVDQILPHPGSPALHEPEVRDAREYVRLAASRNGAVPRPVEPEYVWGDALFEWERARPRVRIVNLETSITSRGRFWTGKEIHYRMNPDNIDCLRAAKIDCCSLANNHVLDWGRQGLLDTLDCLGRAEIATVGAGRNRAEAERPAVLSADPSGRRLLVFGVGFVSSGIPPQWAAGESRPGVWLFDDPSIEAARLIQSTIARFRAPGDRVVISVHWGTNWGYEVPDRHIGFARALIDGGVDLVHGHSSHHPRPIEVYRNKLILYGCGDFIDDYEGISGYESYRDDLALMYFVDLDAASGDLRELRMVPLRIVKLSLRRAGFEDGAWLARTLTRESSRFGSSAVLDEEGRLILRHTG